MLLRSIQQATSSRGLYGGIFRTTDGGTSWGAVNSGLTSTIVSALTISSGGQIFAGTFGGGVFSNGPATSVERLSSDVTQSFVLSQNYPNPFNPTTNFGFRISDFAFVSLKVFDVLGREVAALVNEMSRPGVHTVQWDGKNDRGEPVSSGIYLYQLRAGSSVTTRKMVLLK